MVSGSGSPGRQRWRFLAHTPRSVSLLIGVGLAAVAVFGLSGTHALHLLAAGPSLCPTPVVSGVVDATTNQHFGVPGTTTVTVQGAGYSAPACGPSVEFGVPGDMTTMAAAQVSANQSGTALTFTEPTGPGGSVTVVMTDQFGNSATSNSNYNFWAAPVANLASSVAPFEASTMVVAGSNFTFGRTVTTAPSAVVCDGKDKSEAPVVSLGSDTKLTLSAPSVYCAGPVALTFHAPYNSSTSPANTDPPVSIAVNAGTIDIAARVTSFSGSSPSFAGAMVRVSGNGFGPAGTAALGGLPVRTTWSDTGITFQVPDADGGSVVLTRTVDRVAVARPTLVVQAQVTSASPTMVTIGETVSFVGTGLGSTTGTILFNGSSVPAASWSTDRVTFTVPTGARSGSVKLTPAINTPPPSVALQVIPKILSVTPSTGAVGSLVQVQGSSFGISEGSVSIGGRLARITLWSDTQIILTIPAGLGDGPATIVVTTAGGAPLTATTQFQVSAAAGVAGGGSPTSSGPSARGNGYVLPKNGKPIVSTGPIAFNPPPQTGPVLIQVTIPRHVQPGADIPYVATLTAFSTPVRAAHLSVVIALEPAADAVLTQGTTTTDADGSVHGFIHFSATPGAYLIYASSGSYQNEIEVIADANSISASTGGASTFFVDHISAPSTFFLFLVLIPLLGGILAMSRGRTLAVAGGGSMPPFTLPGRRELTVRLRRGINTVGHQLAGSDRSWRRRLDRSWSAHRDLAWRVIGAVLGALLILIYLLASISTLTALPLTFFGTSTVIPEGTLYRLASVAVSLALTAIALRYIYYYRCWVVSRHYFTHPAMPDLDDLRQRDIPFMKVQVTTKGGAVPVVERSLAELAQILTRHPWLQAKVSAEIITESGEEAAYLQERFSTSVLQVDAVTLPADYETLNGTRLKARALQYMVDKRRDGWNRKPGRTFIVHFDEETLVTEAHLLVLTAYLSDDPRPVSQGPILYPLEWRNTPWICRALESTRPFGCSECARVMENPPPPHLHGSNLVVDEEAENTIGWDFGTLDGQPFIAEDLLFGLRAFSQLGREAFGWHGATMLEQPPLSLHWAVQQRLRWVMGALQGLRAMNTRHEYDGMTRREKRRLMTSIGYRIATYSLGFPVGFAGLYFIVHPAETSTNWGSLVGLWRVLIIASAVGWIASYQIGIMRNLRYQTVDWKERVRQGAVMLVITPIAGLCETVGPFLALLRWMFGARRVSWTPTPKVSDKRPIPTGPILLATGTDGESEAVPLSGLSEPL